VIGGTDMPNSPQKVMPNNSQSDTENSLFSAPYCKT